jgi:hypothetical protein
VLQRDPTINRIKADYFNGIAMIKRKTELALEHGLGGVMIWEIGVQY